MKIVCCVSVFHILPFGFSDFMVKLLLKFRKWCIIYGVVDWLRGKKRKKWSNWLNWKLVSGWEETETYFEHEYNTNRNENRTGKWLKCEWETNNTNRWSYITTSEKHFELRRKSYQVDFLLSIYSRFMHTFVAADETEALLVGAFCIPIDVAICVCVCVTPNASLDCFSFPLIFDSCAYHRFCSMKKFCSSLSSFGFICLQLNKICKFKAAPE